MDTFCISSAILGTEKHMLVSADGFTTTTREPRDVWYLTGEMDPWKPMCLDSLLRLGGIEVQKRPEQKWTKPFDTILTGSCSHNIPWSQAMPTAPYKSFVRNLIKSIAVTIDHLPKDYYTSSWAPSGRFLTTLKAAKVDAVAYKEVSEGLTREGGAFETFRPGHGGFVPPVVYDRFATRTGRLTVDSGPNILTLKREHRKVIKSSFPNGSIVSLDFSALEARIILAEVGKYHPHKDLYGEIGRHLFGGGIERDVVKIAIISELYGSSKNMLGIRLGISGDELDGFIDKIRGYFGSDSLRRRLKDEHASTGIIKNRYGRPLQLQDAQDHLLVNTYAQSTGVDVSLLGFSNVMERLGTEGIRPLFVLHDALILDVREDRMKDVESVSSVNVPTYDHEFPLKLEIM